MFESLKNGLAGGLLVGKGGEIFCDGPEVGLAIADGDENGAKDLVGPDLPGYPQDEAGFSCQGHQGLGVWNELGERNDGFRNLHRNPRSPSFPSSS